MTRQEFMTALRDKLILLSPEEREDAVQFYEEYFDEAGAENEQAVLTELGSPEALAEKILSGEGKIVPKGQRSRGSSTRSAQKNKSRENRSYQSFWESVERTFSSAFRSAPRAPRAPEPPRRQNYREQTAPRPHHRIWPWILLILTSPIWFSILVGLFVCVLSAVITIVCLLITFVLCVLTLVFLSLFCFGLSFYMMPNDPLNALYVLSIGLMGLGGTMILLPIAVFCIKKGFPMLGRGISACYRRIAGLFHRKTNPERSGL